MSCVACVWGDSNSCGYYSSATDSRHTRPVWTRHTVTQTNQADHYQTWNVIIPMLPISMSPPPPDSCSKRECNKTIALKWQWTSRCIHCGPNNSLLITFRLGTERGIPSLGVGAGGFRVAQFVRIALLPSHWPFISRMASSASCNTYKWELQWHSRHSPTSSRFARQFKDTGHSRSRTYTLHTPL